MLTGTNTWRLVTGFGVIWSAEKTSAVGFAVRIVPDVGSTETPMPLCSTPSKTVPHGVLTSVAARAVRVPVSHRVGEVIGELGRDVGDS